MNPEEVEQKLQVLPANTQVMINMRSEGGSLQALGIRAMLDHYLQPQQISIRSWPNTVEDVPYYRTERFYASHFFWMTDRYAGVELPASTHQYRFAAFVGRPTWPRVRMLHDLRSKVSKQCLFSLMDVDYVPRDDNGRNLDPQHRWMPADYDTKAQLGDITSLDGRKVADQYDPRYNANRSLLDHYHRFDIEIASETYTNGATFFPTEKTIRPLLYRKPIMVFGPRHFLRNLRTLGFVTWADYWDESYDDLEGPARWQAMLQQIEILAKCDHFDEIYKDYQPLLDQNSARVREISMQHRPT